MVPSVKGFLHEGYLGAISKPPIGWFEPFIQPKVAQYIPLKGGLKRRIPKRF